jgi:large subunit ribosomal protein L29
MEKISVSELREMSDEQLADTLTDTVKALFWLRVKAQTDRLDVPSELNRNRKLIAQIKTIQSQRRLTAGAK